MSGSVGADAAGVGGGAVVVAWRCYLVVSGFYFFLIYKVVGVICRCLIFVFVYYCCRCFCYCCFCFCCWVVSVFLE